MPRYAPCLRLLPIAAALCVGSCLSTEGYYRNQDGGASGTAGTTGTGGAEGTAGTTGNGGSAAGTTGNTGTAGAARRSAGTTARGGTTGSAGRGRTTGSAGRGGTAGSGGRGGTTGSGGTTGAGVLFMDDFEAGTSKWDLALNLTHSLTNDGSQVLDMSETAGDQALAAAPLSQPNWANISVEARVKVL